MGQTIEEKIVSVQFECDQTNRNFKKMRDNMDSVTDSINKFGEARGFVEAEKNVDSINTKFSTMQFVVSNVLSNIVGGFLNAGTNFVKSLSIDNVTEGYRKYESQIMSVQTMLTATTKEGESQAKALERINKELDKYLWYADETSMTFDKMVSNTSLFLAKGFDPIETGRFVMGLSSMGMGAGATNDQISNAMYQLSQAAGTYIRKQDWMSVKNANMANKKFIELIIETAKELGELSETSNVTAENFEDSLETGFFTGQVLFKATSKYSSVIDDLYSVTSKIGMTTL